MAFSPQAAVVPQSVPQSPSFLNLISAVFVPADAKANAVAGAQFELTANARPVTKAQTGHIADALIRSMLGTRGATSSGAEPKETVATKRCQTAQRQALPTPTSQPLTIQPRATQSRAPQTQTVDPQIPGAQIPEWNPTAVVEATGPEMGGMDLTKLGPEDKQPKLQDFALTEAPEPKMLAAKLAPQRTNGSRAAKGGSPNSQVTTPSLRTFAGKAPTAAREAAETKTRSETAPAGRAECATQSIILPYKDCQIREADPADAGATSANTSQAPEPSFRAATASAGSDTKAPVAFFVILTPIETIPATPPPEMPATRVDSQAVNAAPQEKPEAMAFRDAKGSQDTPGDPQKGNDSGEHRTEVKPALEGLALERAAAVVRAVEAPVGREENVSTPVSKTEVADASSALRSADASVAPLFAQPSHHATPLQQIALRIATGDAPAVELRVAERAGEIHVSVHTPDAGLQTSLRQDLGTLSNSLERSGYHAETFVPQTARAAQSELRSQRESQPGFSRREGGSPQEQQSRDQRKQRDGRVKWIEELENAQ